MKLKDLKNIFSQYTNVKLVVDGDCLVFEGFWHNAPAAFENYVVEHIIPIRHPNNENLGMASILIHYEYEE